jgi:hypothetical protein
MPAALVTVAVVAVQSEVVRGAVLGVVTAVVGIGVVSSPADSFSQRGTRCAPIEA